MTDSHEVQLSDGTSQKDQKWKDAHVPGECSCWMCDHVKRPWVEKLDKAQQRIKELESMLKAAGAEPAVKATQLGQ